MYVAVLTSADIDILYSLTVMTVKGAYVTGYAVLAGTAVSTVGLLLM